MPVRKNPVLEKKLTEIDREAEERDAQRRATRLNIPYADLRKIPVSLDAVKLVLEADAKRAQVAALELKVREVAVAAYDPTSPEVKDIFSHLVEKKYTVRPFVVSRSGLQGVWHYYEFISTEAKEITGKVASDRFTELATSLKSVQKVADEFTKMNFSKVSTTSLFEVILAGAFANKASDVHLEARKEDALLRYRLDGVLHDIFKGIPRRNYDSIISRVKLLAGLKLNVHGEPQDGRFTVGVDHKEIEIRVSVAPTEFGEAIVMRVLDPGAISSTLPDLGLRADDLAIVMQELSKPNGLILNTGPTGSGKTTTLYAFLRHLANPEIKVITIEDPIEYRIDGIEQTQADPKSNYTFANGLKSMLRQDPDVILVGEIRDKETAEIGLQAALTGHMVFSTLHTNDAVGAVSRLIDLGTKPQTVASALTLIIAQRLVRRLCSVCKKEIKPAPELLAHIEPFLKSLPSRVDRAPYEKPVFYEAVGCEACNKTGFKGRAGIFEFLQGGTEFGEIVTAGGTNAALKQFAEKSGMVTMQEDGILKVLQGVTTFGEVEKVAGQIKWEK